MIRAVAALTLAFMMAGQQQQQPVPDAPVAQPSLPDLKDSVAPGKGTTPTSNNEDVNPSGTVQAPPSTTPPENIPPPEELPAAGQAPATAIKTIRERVNFVLVPVTVKDNKGQLVAGLTWRDFRIFEANVRQHISFFTVDPFPLSVAFVIDQSVPSDTMKKVNDSLSALTGAFAPFDEVSVYTYANGPRQETDFTAAQGARLPQVLERAKRSGRDMLVPITSGPLQSGPMINNHQVDPNLAPGHSASTVPIVPKEVHTLNDAILAAAKGLSTRERGRRRIVYVISDGKEQGSQATYRQVLKYLQTNNITLYATLVGDSATWGVGFLDKFRIPFIGPQNDILPKYTQATGGALDAEFSRAGIERSFAKITEQVRAQYTLGYNSPVNPLDSKYQPIEVQVLRPNLNVDAPRGFYPSATPLTRPNRPPAAAAPANEPPPQ